MKKILVQNFAWKIKLKRPFSSCRITRMWEDNIKMKLKYL
jgi:hypothetical protein